MGFQGLPASVLKGLEPLRCEASGYSQRAPNPPKCAGRFEQVKRAVIPKWKTTNLGVCSCMAGPYHPVRVVHPFPAVPLRVIYSSFSCFFVFFSLVFWDPDVTHDIYSLAHGSVVVPCCVYVEASVVTHSLPETGSLINANNTLSDEICRKTFRCKD